MLAAERRNEILAQLKEQGKVIVADLSKKYDVTEETIRRDLEKLERDGFAERTYGGAVLKENEKEDLPFLVRKRTNVEAKKRIAATISEMIEDGDRIMLDASTTALFVAKQIRHKKNITVITNSIEILLELTDMKGWKVLSTGGSLRTEALALFGYQAERMVDDFYVDKTIISCKGVDYHKGFMDSNELEAGIKKQMLGSASTKILAVDSAKFGKASFTKIVDFAGVDMIVTDHIMDEEWTEKMQDCNVKVINC
ncbi:MAG: DeoR/GlpR transcriptional regulator [Roseburia sp.]|nr:DeoR/GlpR transcriptional regulator [Roseburia sp.]